MQKKYTGICAGIITGMRRGTCPVLDTKIKEAIALKPLEGKEMRLFEFNKERYYISLLETVYGQNPEVAVEIDGGQKVYIYNLPTGDESNATFWLPKVPENASEPEAA